MLMLLSTLTLALAQEKDETEEEAKKRHLSKKKLKIGLIMRVFLISISIQNLVISIWSSRQKTWEKSTFTLSRRKTVS